MQMNCLPLTSKCATLAAPAVASRPGCHVSDSESVTGVTVTVSESLALVRVSRPWRHGVAESHVRPRRPPGLRTSGAARTTSKLKGAL